MRLYVIRHGETNWNIEKRMQGKKDIPLNEEGIRLARETGKAMKEIPIDLVISSPLNRAKVTAELITEGRNIPMIFDKRLEEMSFGDWEGEIILNNPILPKDFRKHFHDCPLQCEVPPNGESFQEVVDRTKDFYEELIANEAYQEKSILISTHGAASRCFLNNFFEDKADIWRGCVPKNCAVTIVDVYNGIGNVVELDHIYAE